MDGHEAKCRFKVSFCHEGLRTQRAEYVNDVIYTNILEGIGILKDTIVNTVTLGVGEVVNGTPICRMLLGDYVYRVTLEIREWRGGERASDSTQVYFLVKVCSDNLRMLRGRNQITGHPVLSGTQITDASTVSEGIN